MGNKSETTRSASSHTKTNFKVLYSEVGPRPLSNLKDFDLAPRPSDNATVNHGSGALSEGHSSLFRIGAA